jgi:hypothetical protein
VVCAPAAGQVHMSTEGSNFLAALSVFRDKNTLYACDGETPVSCLLLIPEVWLPGLMWECSQQDARALLVGVRVQASAPPAMCSTCTQGGC